MSRSAVLRALFLLFSLSAEALFAAEGDWHCQPGGSDGHWDCGASSALPEPVRELGADETAANSRYDPLSGETSGPEDQPELLTRKGPFDTPLAKDQPPKTKVSGWDCQASADEGPDRGWICSLTGRDPRGMAHVVSEPGEDDENWTEATAITREDEERFLTLMGKLPANPWTRLCAIKVGKRLPPPLSEFQLTREEREARDHAPTDGDADFFELIDNEVSSFVGSAHLVQADQELWADFITRNLTTQAINAHGNVIYKDKTEIVMADSAHLKGDGRGVFRNSQFILPQVPGRGTSRVTYLDSAVLSRYESFSYTTCPPGNQSWVLHADNVKVNKETGRATAQNAWMTIGDIPLLWTPYMAFPIDGRRVSGFLTPAMGGTSVNGYNFLIPYYFNIAPEMDATVGMRYVTSRGYMSMNEFRYLTDTSQGRILANIMPYDQKYNANDPNNNQRTRGQIGFRDESRFSESVAMHTDINLVSDQNYLYQLGGPLSMVDTNNIQSRAMLDYQSPIGGVNLMANYYQTINPAIPKQAYPYFYLPKLQHEFGGELFDTGLLFSNQTQVAEIMASTSERTTGQRFLMRPTVSMPFEETWGFFRPKATLALNQYSLQSTEKWQETQRLGGVDITQSSNPNFAIPMLSMDAGTYFDRDVELWDTSFQQTIEPRLFYVYIPYANQSQIPTFDSTQYDFTYYQLFRENRYTGYDRIGDTNSLTAAVTTRFIDGEKGYDRFRATLGNIAYFDDRKVTTVGMTPQTYSQSFSNLVADLYGGLTEDWGFYSAGQYNASQNVLSRGQVGLTYNNRQNQILNLIYRYRLNQTTNRECLTNSESSNYGPLASFNDCLNLTDVSFRLPLLAGWHAVGRWQYSLLNNVTQESLAGLEKETCCYKVALLLRRYLNNINTNPDGSVNVQSNDAFFVQVDFKGFASANNDVDKFLQRAITGYRYNDY